MLLNNSQYVKVARNQRGVMELGGNMPKDVETRFALTPGMERSIAISGGSDGHNDNKDKDKEETEHAMESQPSPAPSATSR